MDETEFTGIIKANRKQSRITLENTQNKIAVKEWIKDGWYYALLHNFTRDRIENVRMDCAFSPVSIDLDTLETTSRQNRFTHTFEYGETLLLTEGKTDLEKANADPVEFSPQIDEWKIALEQPNTLRLKECSCVFEKDARLWQYEFEMEQMPSSLGIALDLEPTWTELRKGVHPFSGRYENTRFVTRVKCLINGNTVTGIEFGKHFDRWIYEGNISKWVKLGRNQVELIQPCHLMNTNAVPEPPMIFGDFGVHDFKLVSTPEILRQTRWEGTDLSSYSGAIRFSAKLSLPDALRGRELLLNFDDVKEIAEVFVNGVSCGVRVMPSWKFKVPETLTREPVLELCIRILNTPANRWQ